MAQAIVREPARALQPRHVTSISLGGLIGAGLFVGSGTAISTAGPAVVMSYLIAATVLWLLMRILAELATTLPGVHAFTEFPRVILGARAGFLAGWLYWYFWAMVIPVEAIAGANLLSPWLPVPDWVLGGAIIAVMVAINLLAVHRFGEFEFLFAALKIAALCGFIALAAIFILSKPGFPTAVSAQIAGHKGFAPHGGLAVLAASVTAFFSLTGAEVATVAAAEAIDPNRILKRTTRLLTIRVGLFYLSSIALIICIVPLDVLRPGISPFAVALEEMRFQQSRTLLCTVMLVAVLSTLNTALYTCSRTLFLLAKNGDAPRQLVYLHSSRVPVRSVALSALVGVLGIGAAACFPNLTYRVLVDASGAVMVFLYAVMTVAQITSCHRHARENANHRPPRSSYVVLVILGMLLLGMAATPALRPDLCFSALAVLTATVAALLTHPRSP